MNFGTRQILDGVSFRVEEGDRIAFVGDNGAGKSTLFKIISGKYEPSSGNIIFHGNTMAGFLSQNMDEQDLTSSSLKPRKMQELEADIVAMESEIANADDPDRNDLMASYADLIAEYEAMGGYDYEHRLHDALGGLGLTGINDRTDLMTLSGGEKMRVCLARLIVEHPDVILLDEPTNHLDFEAIEWLEGFLKSYGGAVFVITHDRHFIDSVANRVIELDNGRITMYKGNYSAYKEQKAERLKTLESEIANLEAQYEHQLEVKQTMLSHRNISGYHQREKMVDKLEAILEAKREKRPSEFAKMNFKAVPVERTGKSDRLILKCENVSKQFDDSDAPLFEDVSFELNADNKIFFCGPNGCGKTTLLHMLTGDAVGNSGTIYLSSGLKCGVMGQFVPFEDESRTLYDELIADTDLTVTDARSLLARFGFRGEAVFKTIDMLSGGERSRLYLCKLLEENPDLLILDEPTNHLDINSREILEDALSYYDGAIVCVSHDRFFIDKCADRILGFKNGHAAVYDKYDYYLSDYKKKEAAVQTAKPAEEKEKTEKTPHSSANVNPAKARKELARKRDRLRELEKLIGTLEDRQSELQDCFIKGAGEEEYNEYGNNAQLLKDYYDEFFELGEEIEEQQ
ncbi:MAG: ABC-F family ATP-binding cassette domain-containing protein [Clostridiales bacterium]|nr:ABC-F family ATP-binding cassette domain-containing protein [Clostridiales bacterium]